MNQKGFIPVFLFFIVVVTVVGIFYFLPKNDRIKIYLPPTPTPAATAEKPKESASPTPTPTPQAKTFNLGILVIKYFPLTGENNLDPSVTGDVSESYDFIRKRTISVTNNLKSDLEKASKYLGYKNDSAPSSLNYTIVSNFEYKEPVPFDLSTRKPLYRKIMEDHKICDFVDNKNVREVWLWAYQGPNKDDGKPYLAISESKMAGPFGDISNSYREGDMPVCKYSYRVYTFNYGRLTSEALESWGHQMEAELDAVDSTLFREKFQGPNHPQTEGVNGRCGDVHNPPNARQEYDRENPTPQKSDCLDWQPDKLGTLSDISCNNWGGCISNGDNSASRRFQVWYWQNLPGLGNTKKYNGKTLRNWWDIHGDFDNVMKNSKRLTQ